jgi:hypothetical protein
LGTFLRLHASWSYAVCGVAGSIEIAAVISRQLSANSYLVSSGIASLNRVQSVFESIMAKPIVLADNFLII